MGEGLDTSRVPARRDPDVITPDKVTNSIALRRRRMPTIDDARLFTCVVRTISAEKASIYDTYRLC